MPWFAWKALDPTVKNMNDLQDKIKINIQGISRLPAILLQLAIFSYLRSA